MDEIDNEVEGVRNPFIHNPSRNTREEVEAYLDKTMGEGKWDEWNVRMTKRQFDREDRIARDLEGRRDV